MDIRNYTFSYNDDLFVSFMKSLRLPISTVWKCGFIKLYKFFCDWFFKSKVINNVFKKIIKGFSGQFPKNLIRSRSVFRFSINEMTRTSKAIHKPIKYWKLSIIALNNYFINSFRSVFRFIMLNSKMTFSINKSSKIYIIFNCRFQILFSRFNFIKNFICNKVFSFFTKFNIFNNIISSFSTNCFKKLYIQRTLFFFFNQIRIKFFNKFIGMFSAFNKIITRFVVFFIFVFISSHITAVINYKMPYNFDICRTDNERSIKFFEIIGNVKTSISVSITRNINNVIFFIHSLNFTKFKSFKQQISDNPTELTRQDIDSVIFALIGNSARMISDNIEGDDKFGTSPVRESYWAMCHSDVLTDLENVDGFINTSQYPAQMNILHAEWGSVGNSRWLYSPIGSQEFFGSALGNDLYNCFFTGREAYATIDQDGASAQFVFQGLGSGNDPLLQRQTAGYKFATVPRILNDQWLIALRTTLS